MPKKNRKWGPLVSSGFVGYVKKVKNERGDPFALISADRTWPDGSSFSSHLSIQLHKKSRWAQR